ncbi:MAG: thermonuclease family protein [Pseudomonadota bacterium]|nr:thermonuclease family protein [Pseudomonadota bacterium]
MGVRIGKGLLFGAVAGVMVIAAVDRLAIPAFNRIALQPEGGAPCRVVRVIDGDTMTMYCEGRGHTRARLIGFDTPEIFSPRCPSELRRGLQAKLRLQMILWQADEVSLVRSGTDRYGRGLVSLFVDGRNVAQQMIGEGLARPYDGGQRRGWCA